MSKQKMLTVRMDEELYEAVKHKCKNDLAINVGTLVKIFLKSFVTQKGVGFYVGDNDLADLFNGWMQKKKLERTRGSRSAIIGPKLKDIFDL